MKNLIFTLILVTSIYAYDKFVESERVTTNVSVVSYDIKENFYNVKLGSSAYDVINLFGNPQRIDQSEYDFEWYIYNNNYEKFFMIGIENNKVVSLFSNSINSGELKEIYLGIKKEDISYERKKYRLKENTKYLLDENGEYDIIEFNNNLITVFYDIHDEYRVKSYQIVTEQTENKNKTIYPTRDLDIIDSYENIMLDLINSERIKENLNTVTMSYDASKSAKNHSLDMMDNNFFDHINNENESPFDRMDKEDIDYTYAGENIAAGQTSAIFAHEALMNSLGHRKNILGDNYKYVGIGVEIGGFYNTYYTQNYYQ
ncbi:MAG: CAP-associated domain-containing protein [Peptostreptococcaceae bacterium]